MDAWDRSEALSGARSNALYSETERTDLDDLLVAGACEDRPDSPARELRAPERLLARVDLLETEATKFSSMANHYDHYIFLWVMNTAPMGDEQ